MRFCFLLSVVSYGITFGPATGPGFVLEHSPSPEKYLASTMAGGLGFIGLHLTEWRHLLETVSPGTIFGSVFFGITGLHMAHVAAGVIYLGVLAVGVGRRGRMGRAAGPRRAAAAASRTTPNYSSSSRFCGSTSRGRRPPANPRASSSSRSGASRWGRSSVC